MTVGLVGKKIGMTRIFTAEGKSVPVTVIETLPNTITQVKTMQSDGYCSIQITTGEVKASRVTKPLAGHFAKASVQPGKGLHEFRLQKEDTAYEVGGQILVDLFAEGQMVDVKGISKGKGFAGTVKRHNFRTQDATHGNSRSHRVPGSIGQNQSPGRVFKGKKMAGQMGNVKTTVQNLEVVKVDKERNLLFIKGGVPGCPSGRVIVTPAVKIHQQVVA